MNAPGGSPAADQRFPRSKRIVRRADFVRIQSSGLRVSTSHFLVLLAARGDDAPARLGLVASKKTGPAVARNRSKRLLREMFRRNPELFPVGTDVVIIVRPGASELRYADVETEFLRARTRLAQASEKAADKASEKAARRTNEGST